MAVPWILFAVLGMIVLLAAVAVIFWKKKDKKHEPDYYAFFVMGLIWVLFGVFMMFIGDYEFNPLFAMGIVFLVLGLANKDKWKKKRFLDTQSDSMKVILMIALGVMVLLGIGAYFSFAAPITPAEMFLVFIVLILVAFAAWLTWKKAKEIRKGLPSEDELSKRISHKAGYYAFMAAIWISLGVSWLDIFLVEEFGLSGLTVGQAVGAIIVLTGLSFFISYLFVSRKGVSD